MGRNVILLTSLVISFDVSICSSSFQSKFSSLFVKCLFVDYKRNRSEKRMRKVISIYTQIIQEIVDNSLLTANASETFSNCLDTDATAFAILCFVTYITSENDQPCGGLGRAYALYNKHITNILGVSIYI